MNQDLCFLPAVELAGRIASRELSAREVMGSSPRSDRSSQSEG